MSENDMLHSNSSNIRVEGHCGTWYVIATERVGDKDCFLLEHETYGDEAACVIVDGNGVLVLDDVYNGFDDLHKFLDADASVPVIEDAHETAPTASATTRLFVDMDGTLAEFKAVDTLEKLYEQDYFRSLAPNPNVISAVQQIISQQPDIEVFILSAVLTDSKYALEEKNSWLDEYLPQIDLAHRIFPPCGDDKKLHIPHGVRPTDLLLDDYSKNLTLWEPPARGIKLMNGINGTHGTWQGHRVDHQLEPAALASAILHPVHGQSVQATIENIKHTEPMTTEVKPQNQPRDRGGNGQVVQAIKEHYDLLEFAKSHYGMQFESKGSKGWYRCLEPNSMLINPTEQRFIRHSRHVGGDIIDFVAHFDDCSSNDAISTLRRAMDGRTPMRKENYATVHDAKVVKVFELPEKLQGKYSKLFGFLVNQRGIDAGVVKDMVNSKLLYESAKHHNCVFVGYDYQGVAQSAIMRSTGSVKFIGEAEGGNKQGWVVNPNRKTMFIGEAPIDMMSVMSMLKQGGKDYKDFTFIATGGNPKVGCIAEHIKHNPRVTKVYLCHDNDTAGHALAEATKAELVASGYTGKIERKIPTRGKDFNEELQSIVFVKQPEHEPAQLQQQEVTQCLSPE